MATPSNTTSVAIAGAAALAVGGIAAARWSRSVPPSADAPPKLVCSTSGTFVGDTPPSVVPTMPSPAAARGDFRLLSCLSCDVLSAVFSFLDPAALGRAGTLMPGNCELTKATRLEVLWSGHLPEATTRKDYLAAHHRYRATTSSSLPPPTQDQCLRFVWHVANCHSWYKHLPTMAPDLRAQRFQIFASPTAGMREISVRGRTKYVPYLRDDGTEFHYTWMTTEQYRKRFGCLDFSRGAPTAFVPTADNEVAALPLSLLRGEDCAFYPSAIVHRHQMGKNCFGWSAAFEALGATGRIDICDFDLDFKRYQTMEQKNEKDIAGPLLQACDIAGRSTTTTSYLESCGARLVAQYERVIGSFRRLERTARDMCDAAECPLGASRVPLTDSLLAGLFGGAETVLGADPEFIRAFRQRFNEHVHLSQEVSSGRKKWRWVDADGQMILPWRAMPLVLTAVERAWQHYEAASAVRHCVRGVWGEEAAKALRGVETAAALRSLPAGQ